MIQLGSKYDPNMNGEGRVHLRLVVAVKVLFSGMKRFVSYD
jgi:hypothetical protein